MWDTLRMHHAALHSLALLILLSQGCGRGKDVDQSQLDAIVGAPVASTETDATMSTNIDTSSSGAEPDSQPTADSGTEKKPTRCTQAPAPVSPLKPLPDDCRKRPLTGYDALRCSEIARKAGRAFPDELVASNSLTAILAKGSATYKIDGDKLHISHLPHCADWVLATLCGTKNHSLSAGTINSVTCPDGATFAVWVQP